MLDTGKWLPRRVFPSDGGAEYVAACAGKLLAGPPTPTTSVAYYARLVDPTGEVKPLVPATAIASSSALRDPRVRREAFLQLTYQPLTWQNDTSFWITDAFEYRLELWSLSGLNLATITRSPPWWHPPSSPWFRKLPDYVEPRPRLTGLFRDSSGIIWTTARILRRVPPPIHGQPQPALSFLVLEALDMQGRPLSHEVIKDAQPMSLTSEGYLVERQMTDSTDLFTVMRLQLLGNSHH